jgi:hypothetical protein
MYHLNWAQAALIASREIAEAPTLTSPDTSQLESLSVDLLTS